MIPPYNYTVDDAVLAVFAASTKRQREKLLRIFGELTSDPFLPGDAIQHDHIARPLQVRRFGEWAVLLARALGKSDSYRGLGTFADVALRRK